MTMQYGTDVLNNASNAIETTIGPSPLLRIRTGEAPEDPQAARTGTILVSITLPADWSGDAVNGIKVLAGTWSGNVAVAGKAGHFEMMNAAGNVCHGQGLVSMPWATNVGYVVGDLVFANGNVYRATAAGTSGSTAPSHGTGNATDGTVTWQFVQIGSDLLMQNTNLSVGQTVDFTSFPLSALNLA